MDDLEQFRAKVQVLSSYEEAQSVASFPVRVPSAPPAGLKLSRIMYVLPPWLGDDYRGTAGFLDFVYSGPDSHLMITQGYTTPHDARGAPPGRSGEIKVNGKVAVWIDGQLTVDEPVVEQAPEKNPTTEWQFGRLTLGWHEDGLISYRITASGLSLDQLTQVAESLQ